MAPPCKTFRALVCSILAVLVLIHTTPLYAQDGDSGFPPDSPGAGVGMGLSTQVPAETSSTGAASYSIPIEVPKGRGGIAPNLALAYNSYQGNGWIGVGWLLDMGAIQRSPKSPGGVQYSSSDRFVATANGSVSNLVPRTDSNWDYDGASHFENEIDGAFLNYEFISQQQGWQVRDKSGTIYYYGSNPGANSQQQNSYGTFKWLLDRVQDVNGNYMTVTYRYGATDNQIYLKEIDYTGNVNGLPTTNSVIFDLEPAPKTDVTVSYASRTAVTMSYRLQAIRVYGGGQQARKYQLNYNYSPYTSRSILQSVTQYGSDFATALPAVTFQWRAGVTGCFTRAARKQAAGSAPVNYNAVDLNGDGMADIIYETTKAGNSSEFRVLLSTGNGFGDDNVWGTRTAAYNTNFKSFQLADLNGDGLLDLIYIDSSKQIHVLINTGASFGPDTVISGFTVDLDNADLGFQMADVDGDGVPDLVYESGSTFYVIRGDGNGGFAAQTPWSAPRTTGYCEKKFYAIDLNGDGRADILYDGSDAKVHVLTSTGSGLQPDTVWGTRAQAIDTITNTFNAAPPFRVADVNGDGYPDFVYNGWDSVNYVGTFRVLINNGSGFEQDARWGGKPYYYYVDSMYDWAYFLMGDIDGDGLPDLLYAGTDPIQGPVGISGLHDTGTGFQNGQVWSGIPGGPFILADVNGDGLQDYVCLVEGSSYFDLYTAAGQVPDLLTGISNGIGGSYTIQYTPSSAWPNNQKLPFILQTVSSVSANDGNGNTTTTNYSYSGGYYDLKSREFRGFSDVTKTLQDGTTIHSKFITDYTYDGQTRLDGYVYKGLMYDQLTTGADQSSVHQTNHFLDYPPSSTTHFPWLTETDTITTDVDGAPTSGPQPHLLTTATGIY